jgi:hypothetical protein
VISNPGTVPDARLENPGPNVAAVVEEPYTAYRSWALQTRLTTLRHDRSRYGYIVHSVPRNEMKNLVAQLRRRGQHVFVTDLCKDFYCHFGPGWEDFVEMMATD